MRIRPFEPDDAASVAAIWQYWFRDKTLTPDPDLEPWVRTIFVERPGSDPEVPSLVADEDGRVAGFLGATTTPVTLDGERRTFAGVFPSVVHPDAPSAVASLLLRTFLNGPQAITVSDGGHVKFERIWEALGGRVAPTASLRWMKVFRPTGLAVATLTERSRPGRLLRPALRPLARLSDAAARAAARDRFTAPAPPEPGAGAGAEAGAVAETDLTPDALIAAIERLHAKTRLRPAYDAAYLRWLFATMAKVEALGRLDARLVEDARGRPVGWWVAYLRAGGVARVFALDAEPKYAHAVVDRLLARADAAGSSAVIGRMAPWLRRPLAERGALGLLSGSLQLVHAGERSLLDDALLGRLAFSRLEGENWYWWRISGSSTF